MSTDDHTLVRYIRNTDDTQSTAAITFPDDRDPLLIGESGYMTDAEIRQAESYGIVLEALDESDDPDAVTADLGEKRLEEIAEEEGVDLSGKRSNRAKADAILAARSGQPDGDESSYVAPTDPANQTA